MHVAAENAAEFGLDHEEEARSTLNLRPHVLLFGPLNARFEDHFEIEVLDPQPGAEELEVPLDVDSEAVFFLELAGD